MTEFRYSKRAILFALENDGQEALTAKCEHEIELLDKRGVGQDEGDQFWLHIFSWCGQNNLLMMPDVESILRGETSLDCVFVDLIDPDGEPDMKFLPNGPEPDLPRSELMGEPITE